MATSQDGGSQASPQSASASKPSKASNTSSYSALSIPKGEHICCLRRGPVTLTPSSQQRRECKKPQNGYSNRGYYSSSHTQKGWLTKQNPQPNGKHWNSRRTKGMETLTFSRGA